MWDRKEHFAAVVCTEVPKLMCAFIDRDAGRRRYRRLWYYILPLPSCWGRAHVDKLAVTDKGCDPDVFYPHHRVFCGQGSDSVERRWGFEGIGECEDKETPKD
ncbi:hypothetical protein M404DRAFT_1003042 [Pisolithus tinctorius Marx 270]|uniref:Uncharacterized protein n=1 Tax=Pisolithus tinctorius Marx 270 TaxID=870435 RepID=A0A0C3P2X5_PISTI|nr:hypothetical protein M404DRAFT_1003042 [Pisolithus tinctorius Marx 270]